MGRDRIFQKIVEHNHKNPELSLSISTGYTIQATAPFEPNELFKQADDKMYKEKLQHRQCAGTQFDPALVEKFIWVLKKNETL